MFKNLKIFSRLMLLVGIMCSALIINFLLEFYVLNRAEESLNKVFEGGIEEVDILIKLKDESFNILVIVNRIIEEKISWLEGEERINNSGKKVNDLWDMYKRKLDLHGNQNSAKRNADIEGFTTIVTSLTKIVKNKDKNRLNSYKEEQLWPRIEKFRDSLNSLIQGFIDESKNDYTEEKNRLYFWKSISFLSYLISFLLSILFAILIAFSISKPLNRALNRINQFSLGDLSTPEEEYGRDEVGLLQEAMKKMAASNKIMADSLNSVSKGDLNVHIAPRSDRDVLGIAIQNMISSLRRIIGELKEEMNVLTSTSEEIVSSVSQVASGSAETAAAVTETTTTVEELKQTSHVSDEKAKDVLKSSEETLQVVNSSEKSLGTTIEDMRLISGKMNIISESIVKLSEHSQTIGNIIDTVNDLAEQSNLLAVNAAIEAAKAGEQGKSFGVVAQEIRTLAEQSKAATIQVRSILNDIQNATSAAVLATEQGSKAVEKGVTQSSQTNESMQLLTQSITQVTQAANQIAISSQQQFIGIDQVTIAMNNISEATSQHVDHMKQIETAVISLNSVGKTLKEIVDQYELDHEDFYKESKKSASAKEAYKMIPEKKRSEFSKF